MSDKYRFDLLPNTKICYRYLQVGLGIILLTFLVLIEVPYWSSFRPSTKPSPPSEYSPCRRCSSDSVCCCWESEPVSTSCTSTSYERCATTKLVSDSKLDQSNHDVESRGPPPIGMYEWLGQDSNLTCPIFAEEASTKCLVRSRKVLTTPVPVSVVHQLSMFETTFGVLQESPLAIVPLAAIVWFVARGARRSKLVSRSRGTFLSSA